MPDIKVNLGERSYNITIESGALARVGEIVKSVGLPTRVAVISNPTISRHYGNDVLNSLRGAGLPAELILVPAGERYKTLKTISRIYDSLLDMKIDRKGAIVALGGGVIGDMAGFAAATYMRGIDFYQVPTTLLSQVDASIGGKTGVDLPKGKNLVGAFHQPKAVIIDPSTLHTLPARELRGGLAEVVKHGIIYDREYYIFLKQNSAKLLARSEQVMEHAIRRSVEIKRDVVETDEKESGLRAILNYGHTIGHSIESLTGYRKYTHGEASSIGMVTEALLAEREGIAEEGIAKDIAQTLISLRLPVEMDASLSTEDIIRAVELDKKTLGGKLRLALPTSLGKCDVFSGIGRELLAAAIDYHRTWKSV